MNVSLENECIFDRKDGNRFIVSHTDFFSHKNSVKKKGFKKDRRIDQIVKEVNSSSVSWIPSTAKKVKILNEAIQFVTLIFVLFTANHHTTSPFSHISYSETLNII